MKRNVKRKYEEKKNKRRKTKVCDRTEREEKKKVV